MIGECADWRRLKNTLLGKSRITKSVHFILSKKLYIFSFEVLVKHSMGKRGSHPAATEIQELRVEGV